MCGIVGCAGGVSVYAERAFTDLLVMNQLRGFDSVGVAQVGANKPFVLKDIVSALEFVSSKEYTGMLRGIHRVLIGHNRAATKGFITKENAHPFTHGHITGVHNGTLIAQHLLDDHERFKVDSDNIYHHLSQNTVADTWSKIHGAAALVWWDAEKETINFLRNKERPLYIGFAKENNLVMWASEFYMLQAAAWRQGLTLVAPKMLEVDTHMSIKIDFSTRYKVMVPEMVRLEPCSYTPPVIIYSSNNSYKGSYYSKQRPAWLTIGEDIPILFDEVKENFMKTGYNYKGFCPKDDRINIIYYTKEANFDASGKTLYMGAISHITPVWSSGMCEWDVAVTDIEEHIDKHAGAKCALCPFDKPTKKVCKLCKKASEGFGGEWEKNMSISERCSWCDTLHSPDDILFRSDDGTSICPKCYEWLLDDKTSLPY